MDEEEFDLLMQGRPFGTADAMRMDAQARRCTTLGIPLWGTTPAGLQRQLLAPHPEIPAGFDLADFHRLHRSTQAILKLMVDPRGPFFNHHFGGTQSLVEWEARCEIVRRAIEYLERR
jgi:hypothetical protein